MAAFAADPPVLTFQCSGCGGVDRTVWQKAGVEHWKVDRTTGHTVVCGTYGAKYIQ